MNELALIFWRLGIDTQEVLKAAATKWNFLNFMPGLVGGHCIGVDPYYLVHKAQEHGYQPKIIAASRLLNEGMGEYVASRVMKLMARHHISVVDSRILVMGVAFKENCPDLRNTKVVDIISELRALNAQVDIYDPWVDAGELESEYAMSTISYPDNGVYDAVILAVSHDVFKEVGIEAIRAFGKPHSIVFDVKYLFEAGLVDGRL